jgi:hypothetical protein
MFANVDMARLASYQPAIGGDPVDVTVIPSLQNPEAFVGPSRARRNIMLFEVQVSALAAPRENDELTLDGVTWRVQSRPAYADDERLTWRLEAYEVIA